MIKRDRHYTKKIIGRNFLKRNEDIQSVKQITSRTTREVKRRTNLKYLEERRHSNSSKTKYKHCKKLVIKKFIKR